MRTLIVALVAAALVGASGVPAAAQNYQMTIQLRYWGTGLYFNQPALLSATDPGRAWGGTLRFDHRPSRWSFSARYDSASVTPTTWVWNGASLWDANVHYRFGTNLHQYFGIFAGYGYFSPNDTLGAAGGSTAGLRYGAEFMWRQPTGLYVTGDIAFGSWTGSGFAGSPGGSMTDYRIAVGHEFQGGWGLEGGYRYFFTSLGVSNDACPADRVSFGSADSRRRSRSESSRPHNRSRQGRGSGI